MAAKTPKLPEVPIVVNGRKCSGLEEAIAAVREEWTAYKAKVAAVAAADLKNPPSLEALGNG